MKSMLHEAPTIQKAIEQAWHDAGKPAEFSIKILDAGEKGLLWFSKRPAIISITFDPKKANEQALSESNNKTSLQRKPSREKKPYQKQDKKETPQNRNQRYTVSEIDRNTSDRSSQKQNKVNVQPNLSTIDTTNILAPNIWTTEASDYVSVCLKDVISILDISNSFTTQQDKKILHILFEKKISKTADEEKMLFISLSYLLMQFLKKKFKKKFRGFQLILNTKETRSNDSNNSKESQRAPQ